MLHDIFPDSQGMAVAAVKSPVHKLDPRHFPVDEKLQFFFYQVKIPEPEFLINRRKAVTTGKGTSPAGFIIQDLMGRQLHFFIYKRNL